MECALDAGPRGRRDGGVLSVAAPRPLTMLLAALATLTVAACGGAAEGADAGQGAP